MSGSIDPSIIARLGGANVTQPINMLQQAGQALGLQGQQLSNQNSQMTIAARQAIGQAQQQATDPTTGQVDQGKFRALVAASPAAAYEAQAAGTTSLAQGGQGLSNETATLANQKQKIGFLAGLAAPLAAQPNVSAQDVTSTIQHAVNFGLIDAPTAQQALNSITSNPGGVRAALGQFLKANMSPTDEYAHIYGSQGSQSNGSSVLNGTVAPADQGGGFTPGTATPLGLSPGEQAQQVGSTGPNGQPIVQPLAGRLGQQGMGGLVNPGSTHSTAPGAQLYPWNRGGGYPQQAAPAGQQSPGFPPQGTPGGAPPAQPAQAIPQQMAAAAAAPAGGAIPVGPVPGQVAAQEAAGAGSGAAYVQAQTRAAGFSQRQYQAQTALGALQQLGPTGTGPGSEGRNAIVSYAASLGLTAPSDATKAYDEANKYLTQMALAQPGATSSEGQLASALTGNASTHISNLAAQDVVKANVALDRQTQGALLAFQQSGQTPDQWQKFATHWSSTVDPRVYAFDLLSPAQRTSVMAGMSTADKAKFYGQVQQAVGLGLVKPPTAGVPAAAPVAPTAVPVAAPTGAPQVPLGD